MVVRGYRLASAVLYLTVLFILGAPAATAFGQTARLEQTKAEAPAEPDPAGVLELDYWQAKAAGYHVPPVPEETGLPTCPPAEPYAGVSPSDPAPPDDAPVCAVDPRTSGLIVLVGLPTAQGVAGISERPVPGTRLWTGAKTATDHSWEGGKNLVEVGNPAVCHSGNCGGEQFYARTLVITTGGHEAEAGWTELYDKPNDQYVYDAFETTPIILQPQYDLTRGNEYAFRVRQCGSPGELNVCTEIFWNGNWDQYDSYTNIMRCQNQDGSGNCLVEHYMEAFSGDKSWFDLNCGADGTSGCHYRDARVRRDPSDWPLLDKDNIASATPKSNSPDYIACWNSFYYNFNVKHGSTC